MHTIKSCYNTKQIYLFVDIRHTNNNGTLKPYISLDLSTHIVHNEKQMYCIQDVCMYDAIDYGIDFTIIKTYPVNIKDYEVASHETSQRYTSGTN